MTYTFLDRGNELIISGYTSEGALVERSVLNHNTGVVVQEIADGEYDGTIYHTDEFVVVEYENIPSKTISNLQVASNGTWTEPPLRDDNGLRNSPVFPGYKYLGSTQPDSIYNVAVGVHRYLSFKEGQAIRFQVSPGTKLATLASIIIDVASKLSPKAMLVKIAMDLAAAFAASMIDSIATGNLTYRQYHYTYKFNGNGSKDYSYKCCECREWWVLYDNNGKEILAEKDMMALNHISLDLIEKCRSALMAYADGEKITATCSLAAP